MHLFWFLSCIDDDVDDDYDDAAAADGSTKAFEVLIGETSKVGISLVSAHRIREHMSMSAPIDSGRKLQIATKLVNNNKSVWDRKQRGKETNSFGEW